MPIQHHDHRNLVQGISLNKGHCLRLSCCMRRSETGCFTHVMILIVKNYPEYGVNAKSTLPEFCTIRNFFPSSWQQLQVRRARGWQRDISSESGLHLRDTQTINWSGMSLSRVGYREFEHEALERTKKVRYPHYIATIIIGQAVDNEGRSIDARCSILF